MHVEKKKIWISASVGSSPEPILAKFRLFWQENIHFDAEETSKLSSLDFTGGLKPQFVLLSQKRFFGHLSISPSIVPWSLSHDVFAHGGIPSCRDVILCHIPPIESTVWRGLRVYHLSRNDRFAPTDVRNDVMETCDLEIPYLGLGLGIWSSPRSQVSMTSFLSSAGI